MGLHGVCACCTMLRSETSGVTIWHVWHDLALCESSTSVQGRHFVMQLSVISGRCYQLRVSRNCLSTRATSSSLLTDLVLQPKLCCCFRRGSIYARAAQNVTKASSVCVLYCLIDPALKKTWALQSQGGRMRPPSRVLLTNDDGPESTFFQAWVQHVKDVLK